jgi:hypothetical protein
MLRHEGLDLAGGRFEDQPAVFDLVDVRRCPRFDMESQAELPVEPKNCTPCGREPGLRKVAQLHVSIAEKTAAASSTMTIERAQVRIGRMRISLR